VVAASPGADAGTQPVGIAARPPQVGATPTQIVEGFLGAMSSYERGFGLAEQFLTPAARDGWNRTAIEVYNRTVTEPSPPSIVRLLYDRAAQIDETGRYTRVPDSEPQQYPLRLEQDEAGEWRIATPPPFLLISSFDLSRTYGPFDTYFADPDGRVLVPDQVWLPTVEPQLALLLTQAVVDGPTGLIGPRGVANPFPADTLVSSAEVSGSVVTVVLSGPTIAETDGDARRLMVAQLTATIQASLPGVERVDLTIGGGVVDVPDISGQLDALAGLTTPPAYLLSDTNAVLADPSATSVFTAVPGPLGRGELGARSLAVSLDRTTAATVDETGTEVWRTPLTDDGEPVLVYTGQDVAPPSFDRYGNLWLVDRLGDGRTSEVKLVPPDGPVLPVLAPELDGDRVSDLRIAPDGVRVAVVAEGVGAVLRLGHVLRGEAPEVDLTVDIPFDGTVSDVAWAGETDLLVVVRPADGIPRPYTVSVDGSGATQGSQTGITSVAAYEDRPAFAVTDVRNVLRQASVLRWDQVSTGAEAVTYPG